MAERRVVVTGLGAVSPCGLDAESTWQAMVGARSGIGVITAFPCEDWPVRIAGEVRGFDPDAVVGKKEARRTERFTWFAIGAAEEAMRDAGLAPGQVPPHRLGVYIGSGIGGLAELLDAQMRFAAEGRKGLSPFTIPKAIVNLAGGHVAMRHDARGPSLAVATACATGNHSIGEAWRVIRTGEADVILAGGAEATIVPVGLGSFMVSKALSSRNDDPATASRPFDVDRDGFVMGEGAGVLVLEELERARARGARIYAEVSGYGLTNDAWHITLPGNGGAERCMEMALRSARVNPEDVGYINAHGTSTQANDSNETRAIRTVFGAHADRLMVSSTKGVTGHLLGAAGGVEALAVCRALHDGVIPPTANWHSRDPECDLDVVPNEARQVQVEVALSNGFGFGGTNATLVFRRFHG